MMKAIAWRFIDDFAPSLTRPDQPRPGRPGRRLIYGFNQCVAATAKSTAQPAALHDDEPAMRATVIVKLL